LFAIEGSLGGPRTIPASCCGKSADKGVSPSGDIFTLDVVEESAPALDSLPKLHRERAVQGLGDLLRAVRVDDQGGGELVGCAGEARKDQDAGVLRVLGGDELLGD
jgi:hypothetical protein